MSTAQITPLYVGTKTVHATPMSRLAYNEYRGWALPADENGEDPGFLVEYVDGGKSNDSRHAGYISWSPADVFERSYKPFDPNRLAFASIAGLAIGAPLEGGIFAGVITQQDGTHAAVVLLPNKPEGRLAWSAAMSWAKTSGGQLPTRPIAALLFANLRSQFEKAWHWTNETHKENASFAWIQDFYYGYQFYDHKSFECCARAVRLIQLGS